MVVRTYKVVGPIVGAALLVPRLVPADCSDLSVGAEVDLGLCQLSRFEIYMTSDLPNRFRIENT